MGEFGVGKRSATSRSLERLRKDGAMVQLVETTNVWSGTKKDLFGFLDVLALYPGRIVGIQVTGGGNLSARRKKILGERRKQSLAWLHAGGEVLIHDWRKTKPRRGGKALRWTCREVAITLEDYLDDVWD